MSDRARILDIEKSVGLIRERVFNGLTEKIEEVNKEVRWIKKLLVGFLVTALLGMGILFFQQRSMRFELLEHEIEVTEND